MTEFARLLALPLPLPSLPLPLAPGLDFDAFAVVPVGAGRPGNALVGAPLVLFQQALALAFNRSKKEAAKRARSHASRAG